MKFSDLGLSSPILKAVSKEGYNTPTAIQEKAIPAIIKGLDLMATAQTGTGKTAAFTLPILEKLMRGNRVLSNEARALIVTPTRELAAQIAEAIIVYGKNVRLSSAVVFGGVKINPQMMKLRKGVDILVATPGRLLDLNNQNAIRFEHLEILVLDEADRMLDMGFINDIKKIINLLPKKRQNLMFSATFPSSISELAKGIFRDPLEISVSPKNTIAPTVNHHVYPVDKKQKPALLTKLIEDNMWYQVLVFCRTKHGANKLTRHLEKQKIKSAAIHGNKSQGARTKALADFKSCKINILVATDIAARGIDIEQLPQVVNFDLPNVPEDYIHRIGRTGRAGIVGEAISLVCADEFEYLADIENLTGKIINRIEMEGFTPVHVLPESELKIRSQRIRRKKKFKKNARADNKFKKNPRTDNKFKTTKKSSSKNTEKIQYSKDRYNPKRTLVHENRPVQNKKNKKRNKYK